MAPINAMLAVPELSAVFMGFLLSAQGFASPKLGQGVLSQLCACTALYQNPIALRLRLFIYTMRANSIYSEALTAGGDYSKLAMPMSIPAPQTASLRFPDPSIQLIAQPNMGIEWREVTRWKATRSTAQDDILVQNKPEACATTIRTIRRYLRRELRKSEKLYAGAARVRRMPHLGLDDLGTESASTSGGDAELY